MGAMDYVMTQTQNESYMSAFTPEQLEFFYGMPSWAVASWAVGVWGGVVGCLLLLMRKRLAVGMFLASLVGMVITAIQNYILSNGLEVAGDTFSIVFTIIIFLVAIALYVYAKVMSEKGVLR